MHTPDKAMLDAARIHQEAVEIIQQAIHEITSICPTGCKQAATAILARLAHANLLLERYDPEQQPTNESEAER